MSGPSCDTQVVLFSMVGKPLMSRGALSWFLMFRALVDKLLNVEQFFH